MSDNNSHLSDASRNEGKNAGAGNKTTRPGSEEQLSFFSTWPWCAQLVLILSVIACIVVLLVGLPVASLMIVEGVKPDSIHATVSFWGASFAAFISLSVVFIASVFAFTALKVETGARREAQKAAEKEVKKEVEKQVKTEINMRFRLEVDEYIKKHGASLTRQSADDYIRDKWPTITRQSADDYIKDEWPTITRQSADDYIRDKWEKITEEAADGYLVNNGRKLVIEAAGGYLKDNGPEPTKKAAVAYIEEHGERVATEAMEKYAATRTGLRGWLRGIVKPKDAAEGSPNDTQTGGKQAPGDASSDTPDDGPNNTGNRS